MVSKSTLAIVLTVSVLSCSVAIYKEPSSPALADSPLTDHQETMNSDIEWKQIPLPEQVRTLIPDDRMIYYKTANNITQCIGNDKRIFDNLPNITSVSYSSDGNTLNTTFWLSKAPLINHTWQNVSRSNIDQNFLMVEHFPVSEAMAEANNFTLLYPNLKIINYNYTNITEIGRQPANQISFNGTVNNTMFGYRNFTGFSLSAQKSNEIYRILNFAEPEDFNSSKPVAEEMIRSFEILNNSDGQPEDNKSKVRLNNNMEINLASNWNYSKLSQNKYLLFSPINFYFMGTAYVALVDVPSFYDGPTDFMAKLVWWHKFPENKWAKFVEEVSSGGPTRTLEEKRNFTEFFNKTGDWEAYAFMPISLRTINSPNEYLILFFTGATYVLNGLLCDLVESTDVVSNPPPKLSISPLKNSSSFGPAEEKTIEIRVNSFSDIPYNIIFENQLKKFINATFEPSTIQVPASGWNTTQLHVKRTGYSDWDNFTWTDFIQALPWNTETQTIPIAAKANISSLELKPFSFENKSVSASFSSRLANSPIESSSIAITALNWPDYAMSVVSILSSPVSVFVPIAGIIGGIIAWFLKREKDKRELQGEGKGK